jgi:hypothetical protein
MGVKSRPSQGNVPAGSSVVDPNAPAPTEQTQSTQQSSTTTTTTNPDGSQTDQTTASVSCASGQHSNRTFGSVLQDHYNVWSASGLLGTLEVLKNLSWPTTFPTYTLQSSVMGTFTFDFNAWSGVINALRALVIAGASFVATGSFLSEGTDASNSLDDLLLSRRHDRVLSRHGD